jgi:hypothetical protein
VKSCRGHVNQMNVVPNVSSITVNCRWVGIARIQEIKFRATEPTVKAAAPREQTYD